MGLLTEDSAVPAGGALLVLSLLIFQVLWRVDRGYLSTPLNALRSKVDGLQFLVSGIEKLTSGYLRSCGKPYELQAPDHKYVMVSAREQVHEIDTAAPTKLSLFGATRSMFQPEHTMHGFNWVDCRGQDGIGYVRAIRSLLTAHIPQLLPGMRSVVAAEFQKSAETRSVTIGGVKYIQSWPTIKHAIVQVNGFVFFGKELVANEIFMKAAYESIEHVIKAAEWIRILPKIFAPLIGKFLSSSVRSQEIWHTMLVREVEGRLERKGRLSDGRMPNDHPNDVIQWVIDTAPREQNWSPGRIVHEIMALWFGSIHSTSITCTMAFYDLCLHPEYREPLRAELASAKYLAFAETGHGLPLLDSFLKESARLSPVDSVTCRRQALDRFRFRDGTTVAPGDWTCVPFRALTQDPELFPQPHEFNGFRFVDAPGGARCAQPEGPSGFTDVSYGWSMWGSKRLACPARFYATTVIKLVLAHTLTHYEPRLKDEGKPRSMNWRTYLLPNEDTLVELRPLH